MESIKKKLLVLTPYYPSDENTFEGIFVKQQIEMINSNFESLVVFRCQSLKLSSKKKIPKFSYVYNSIKVINLFYIDNNFIARLFGNRMIALKFQIFLNYYLRFLFTIKFDIVLSQWILPSTFLFSFFPKNKKIVSVIRGMDITILKKQFPEYFLKSIKRSSAIITNGSYAINIVKDVYSSVIIENVYNPKNLKVFLKNELHKTNNKTGEYIFTCVGRFDNNKRQDLLINLVKKLLTKNIKVTLYLIGIGSERRNLENLSQSLGVEKNIIFKANLTHKEIAEVYSKTDVYLQPSMREGVPNALVEAMASGCCCIARNVGGIPDLIKNRKTGYLFRKDEEIYSLIVDVLQIDNYIIQMKAREKISKMFNNELNISKLLRHL